MAKEATVKLIIFAAIGSKMAARDPLKATTTSPKGTRQCSTMPIRSWTVGDASDVGSPVIHMAQSWICSEMAKLKEPLASSSDALTHRVVAALTLMGLVLSRSSMYGIALRRSSVAIVTKMGRKMAQKAVGAGWKCDF